MKVVIVGNFSLLLDRVEPQVETIARCLEGEGVTVVRTSWKRSKVLKGLDIIRTSLRESRGPQRADAIVAQVFNNWNMVGGLLSVLCGRAVAIPVIVLYHGGNAERFLSRWGRVVAPVFRQAFSVQVASEYIGGILRRWAVPYEVVPHVLDASWVRQRVRERAAPRILWVRAFHEVYDPFMALDVLRHVLARRPDASLTMVGRGELREAVERVVRQEGLPVRFLDVMPRPKLAEQLDTHDIFLHTNRVDNQPLSVLEAMAAGMIPVTTRVGGLPYVFEDGQAGFQVPWGDARAAADRILTILEDSALARRMSKAAPLVAARHEWPALRERWMDLLERAAGRSRNLRARLEVR